MELIVIIYVWKKGLEGRFLGLKWSKFGKKENNTTSRMSHIGYCRPQTNIDMLVVTYQSQLTLIYCYELYRSQRKFVLGIGDAFVIESHQTSIHKNALNEWVGTFSYVFRFLCL